MKRTDRETAYFCRGLALLLHGGISPADGVYLLAGEEGAQWLTELGSLLDQGIPLSEAMARTGEFPDHVTGLIRVGERTGGLEEALNALADQLEEQCRIREAVRRAAAYPGMIFLLMLAVIGVLLVKVLPVFDDVYKSLGSRLTGAAAGLLHLGQGLKAMLPVLLAALVLLAAAAGALWCVPSLRDRALGLWRRKFGDRGIAARFSNARYARGLAMGLAAGLPMEEAMALSRQLLGDIPAAVKRCEDCEALVRDGVPLAEALTQAELLSAASGRLLAVSLRSGSGEQMMAQIAKTMMEDAFAALETAVSRVEPAMVLAASVLVGGIILTVMLPLMNILSAIG